MLGFTIQNTACLKRHTETIPADGVLRIDLHRSPRERLRISQPLRVVAARTRLHEHYAQSDVSVTVSRRPRNRIPVRGFSIVPTLLIGVYVTQSVGGACVARFEFQNFPVRSFSVRKLARVTSL